MDAQHLNIDTIKENRNFKGITQEETKELIDTLYAFSVLSYEHILKKIRNMENFDLKGFCQRQKATKRTDRR